MDMEAEWKAISEKQAALNSVLLKDDDLGVIVRAHIYIETELDEFIRARLDQPEALKSLKLDFDGRANLAVGLGLDKGLKALISSIGSLRNDFAHNLRGEIGRQEANNLRKAMKPPYIDACRVAYKKTLDKLQSTDKPKSINDLPPKDQVILYLVNAWGAMASAALQARQAKAVRSSAT